jgi:hypothetical protein
MYCTAGTLFVFKLSEGSYSTREIIAFSLLDNSAICEYVRFLAVLQSITLTCRPVP